MSIRDSIPTDLPAILEIYNDAVTHTTAVWNDVRVDLGNRAAWLADRQARGFPVLVAEANDGQVIAYASYGDWRAWPGYRHTVEHSIYVASPYRGRGIGRALLLALIGRARGARKHVMIGGIEASNSASICLHTSLGFETVARLNQVGCKFGRWLDLVFMQLTLDQLPAPPDHLNDITQ